MKAVVPPGPAPALCLGSGGACVPRDSPSCAPCLHQLSAVTGSNYPGSICLGLCTAGEALRSCTPRPGMSHSCVPPHRPAVLPNCRAAPGAGSLGRGVGEWGGGCRCWMGEPECGPPVPQDSQLCLPHPPPTILVLSPDLAKRSQKFITLGLLGPPGGAQCSNGEGKGRTSPHEGDRLTFQCCLPP